MGETLIGESLSIGPLPFGENLTFNKGIRFGNLRVSNLPLETRVCFDIVCLSNQGERLILGCCTKNLFDHKAQLVQGLVKMNVWPFYRVDPRMVC